MFSETFVGELLTVVVKEEKPAAVLTEEKDLPIVGQYVQHS